MGGEITDKPWYCTYHPLTGEWEDVDVFIKDFMCQNGLSSDIAQCPFEYSSCSLINESSDNALTKRALFSVDANSAGFKE